MKVLHRIADLREFVGACKRAGERIAFVPTMGHLHAGHLSLVSEAQQRGDRVIVSVFVNPLQFSQGEDFGEYPRTLDDDCSKLSDYAVDVVFAPSDAEMYPHGRENLTQVQVPGLSSLFCGEFRAGHFEGVTTVVSLLFNLVQPDVAVFGQKDYQQLAIIRRMVRDLRFPVEIVGMPTRREPGGLAMSSRNAYLSAEQREQACAIYAALRFVAASLTSGEREFAALEAAGEQHIVNAGLEPQFFNIRAPDLSLPDAAAQQFVVLAAAKLGRTRLIDNVLVAPESA